MLGSPLYKPFIKALEDETSKKDDHLKIFLIPSLHLKKLFFNMRKFTKVGHTPKMSWINLEMLIGFGHLQNI